MFSINSKNNWAYVTATAYAFITGLSFLFVKIALKYTNPLDLLAFRFTAAFIAVVVLLLCKVVKIKYSKEKILKILPLAILYPLLFFSLQAFGLNKVTSLEAGILNAIMPVVTAILAALLLKEKTTVLQKISIVLSVVGVIYITVSKSTVRGIGSSMGVLLIFLSAISISTYKVLAKKYTKNISSIELSFIMIIIGFICFNIIFISNHIFNGTLSSIIMPLRNVSFVVSVLYLGVLSSLCTALFMNYTLSKIEASKMSVFANLATVISIIAGAIVLHEKLYIYHLIGSILILIGVLGTNFLDKKN